MDVEVVVEEEVDEDVEVEEEVEEVEEEAEEEEEEQAGTVDGLPVCDLYTTSGSKKTWLALGQCGHLTFGKKECPFAFQLEGLKHHASPNPLVAFKPAAYYEETGRNSKKVRTHARAPGSTRTVQAPSMLAGEKGQT